MSRRLPSTQGEWDEIVKEFRLEHQNIHDFKEISSASEIGIEQFLLLQVIWTVSDNDKALFQPKKDSLVIQPDHFKAAKAYLSNAESWTEYMNSLREPKNISAIDGAFPDIGSMSAARYWQLLSTKTTETEQAVSKFSPIMTRSRTYANRLREIPQTPTPATRGQGRTRNLFDVKQLAQSLEGYSLDESSQPGTAESEMDTVFFDTPESSMVLYPSTEDEQIVNTALLLLLTGITMHFDMPARWSLHRKAFMLKNVDGKVYEARVDGYLLCTTNSQVKAIAEVKPFLRQPKIQAIQMQEGAQMAAWISNYPDQTDDSTKTFR
jgi:hypothetical protein